MKDSHIPLLASILICTRNRAAYLGETIREAAAQTLSSGDFEIVVVDNGSTDCTPDVVRECQDAITQVSLRYVVETEVGLSAARNRAIREAVGQILCFLDDDAVPEPEWLEWLIRAYTAGGPRVMCVGGAIIPIYEIAMPIWFPQEMEFTFKPKITCAELHSVVYPCYPYGANLSIRAEAVRLVGMFNTSLGYNGQNLIPCEETELLLRLEKAGYKIIMETRAVVRHNIPAKRLTRDYLRVLYYSCGRGYALMKHFSQPKESRKNIGRLSLAYKLAISAVPNVWLRGRYWLMLALHRNTLHTQQFYRQCLLADKVGYSNQELILRWQHFRGSLAEH
jgi:glycosyltransferase involved in cell wall biosynthesis